MSSPVSLSTLAAATSAQPAVPVRHWHPNGYKISVYASLLIALAIGIFFIGMAGWSPADASLPSAYLTVTWVLLTYIWIQMGSLILVGAGTKNQMWVDALTSILPMFVIFYVLIQHHAHFVPLSPFQASVAWVTAYTMLLDLVIDLGVTVLLSRQVVDIGGRGVG